MLNTDWICASLNDSATIDWVNVSAVVLWLLNSIKIFTAFVRLRIESVFKDTSEMLTDTYTFELMIVEFHDILTSMLMVFNVFSALLIDSWLAMFWSNLYHSHSRNSQYQYCQKPLCFHIHSALNLYVKKRHPLYW